MHWLGKITKAAFSRDSISRRSNPSHPNPGRPTSCHATTKCRCSTSGGCAPTSSGGTPSPTLPAA
eukprot:5980848-Alexandrium_andersonii.AAC.1